VNREWELHVSIRDARFLFTICQREPIERFEAALNKTPERIALREIGETFVLPA